jgi:methionyl-tRNA formyltransferase
MKIRFYVAGKKGFATLEAIIKQFGESCVDIVITARDSGVENDWSDEIFSLCQKYRLRCYLRNDSQTETQLPDYSFAIGWRWMIEGIHNLIVFHDSPLPKYRGFAPLANMLINGEREIGATALLGTSEYDKGGILYQHSKKISYPKKIADAIEDIINIYAILAFKIIENILNNNTLVAKPQTESQATYSPWRDENDYLINWHQDSDSIVRFVNALGPPYRGAASRLNGETVRIYEIDTVQDVFVECRKSSIGKVIFMDRQQPVIICGSGLVRLAEIRKNGEIIPTIPFRSRFE